MKNHEISMILTEFAELYDMKDVPFKPRAFDRAAESVAALDRDIEEIYKEEGIAGLENIPGVGKGIAERIEEYLTTGKIKEYDRLKKEFPVEIAELTAIEGVGPKLIKLLYQKLKVKNIADLEKAARAGKLRALPRMGEKLEKKILKGIEFKKEGGGRFLLGEALPLARQIRERLLGVKGVKKVELAGSLRRWQETVGDIDILAISDDPEKVCDYFAKMPTVSHVYAKGEKKVLVRLEIGIDADLRVVPPESFGAALQYFTGNKEHNIEVRKIAIKKGYKLNEYGLFRGEKNIAAWTEEVVYEKLGMDTPPPEIRTNSGEIEAALRHQLPKLLDYGDLRGDLQTQTSWTDGKNSIEEMAKEAEKLGHEYIAITDHTRSLAMTGGSDEKKLLKQMAEVDRIQKKFKKIKILKGAEVNILKDGLLDIDDKVLAKLDVVGAAVHSLFNLPREKQTERVVRAMENPHLDILFHPTGRIVGRRKPIDIS
ncbi:MAG: PHP domain-containing protein, partial [Patescibacteria group bacterium]